MKLVQIIVWMIFMTTVVQCQWQDLMTSKIKLDVEWYIVYIFMW